MVNKDWSEFVGERFGVTVPKYVSRVTRLEITIVNRDKVVHITW